MRNAAPIDSVRRFWSDASVLDCPYGLRNTRCHCMQMLSGARLSMQFEIRFVGNGISVCFYAILIWPVHRWWSKWVFLTLIFSLFSGDCIATVSQMAVREWLHIHNVVSIGSHQFGEHRTRKTLSVLVSNYYAFPFKLHLSPLSQHTFASKRPAVRYSIENWTKWNVVIVLVWGQMLRPLRSIYDSTPMAKAEYENAKNCIAEWIATEKNWTTDWFNFGSRPHGRDK